MAAWHHWQVVAHVVLPVLLVEALSLLARMHWFCSSAMQSCSAPLCRWLHGLPGLFLGQGGVTPLLCCLLCCSMVASMAWTMWCFYGLNYAFAYVCFYYTSMGHYTWYLVSCNELSAQALVLRAPRRVVAPLTRRHT
jgi:hypothetical protein